ncbi:MAG: NlpC/P60 family protein, partial [Pedobacter sp.]
MLNGVAENGKVKIKLPDNKTFVVDKSQAVSVSELTKNKDKVVLNAKKRLDIGLKGKTNYLWGGSVNENIDCSGFNQSIFRLEGIMLPRDADQQQSFTKPVAVTLDKIDQLKPGDLLFFSGNRSYATHTGIYIGDYKFIHSSPKGAYRGIKINSLKGGGEYDKFLQKIYFGGGRV